ncbi:MAG: hypothetical protein H6835_15335 [Planctomycetes bacterium]|nr:hypothetical protein [Planctomycetota bacterium]
MERHAPRFALPLPLPAAPALHGATFACQGAGIDAQGPFANLAAFSGGLEVTIDSVAH